MKSQFTPLPFLYRFTRYMALVLSICTVNALASSDTISAGSTGAHNSHHHGPRADSHAPIGVMGDHIHQRGEWMLSYRYMNMQMKDNLQGDDSITADQIATTVANRFGPMPPTLRIVPTKMQTEMHMFGAMYAPSDSLTLMAMINYTRKNMDHLVFQGGMGTTVLETFTTRSEGFGDSKITGLVKLYNSNNHRLHANLGLSVPTGDIEKRDQILTPMGMPVFIRLPYPMQLGSGTWDFEPGITYSGNGYSDKGDKFAWGAQYRATLRIDDNDEDYSLGDQHSLNIWTSYSPRPWAAGTLRLSYTDLDKIDGIDANIAGPVQTADPDNSGWRRLDLAVGINLLGYSSALQGHRLGLEYSEPLKQHVNGVQLEMQSMFTLGYQYSL